MTGPGRRAVVGAGLGAGLGVVAGAVLVPPAAAYADGATAAGLVYRGRFTGVGDPDWYALPVEVPRGTTRIEVSYDYDKLETGAGVSFNIIDIGIFDPGGVGLGDAAGFRGWSGGARDRFSISRTRATPGYLAGPITPGTWHVVLGPFTIIPPGVGWTVTVTLHRGRPGRRFRPRPAPRRVRGTGPGWYRGDLHTHTVHSDGRHTQRSLLALAREAGLDFLASTEHNTTSAQLTWGRHVPDDFLVLPGEEVTTRAGHCVTFGQPAGAWIDWRYRPEDDQLGRFTDRVRALGGMAVAAHPFAPTSGSTWQYDYADVDAVELWNGPWTLDDQTALSHWHALLVAGRFVPAVGSSDSHHDGQQVGRAQTVVRAGSLSVGAIVRGLRGGHAWLAESAAVDLSLQARLGDRTATCGDSLDAAPTDLVDVRLEVAGAPGCVVQLWGPLGPLAGAVTDTEGAAEVTLRVAAGVAPFVRAEVRRADGAPVVNPVEGVPAWATVALSNPVFLGPHPGRGASVTGSRSQTATKM
ncbi:CehA/McbA family metallohydrolase [Nocardioides dokdonensis]|uniref:CehA/McbA family metallohydrolase n=1 Tax=Nocardioides dokdonensis TaxID=450734 RepID=UPI0008365BA2|nr:CehA/McbA family metallohydrolase [Nocardioides dokdonensis]